MENIQARSVTWGSGSESKTQKDWNIKYGGTEKCPLIEKVFNIKKKLLMMLVIFYYFRYTRYSNPSKRANRPKIAFSTILIDFRILQTTYLRHPKKFQVPQK